MILNQFGEPIPDVAATPPPAGIMYAAEARSDREVVDASRNLTPVELDRIMMLANGGDVEQQCQLARELPEKNHDVAHALSTRVNALLGCKYHVEPGADTPEAEAAAEAFSRELDAAGMLLPGVGMIEGFPGLLGALCDAILPGFSAVETVWKPGGAGFYGWRPIEPRFLSFSKGFSPRVRVFGNMSDGVEPPPGKLIYARMGRPGVDPARGGLIRPLAWLHCFANLNLKDLLSFIERYGMPFVVAKIDRATYEKEGNALNNLIRNFGPRGGGVFSRAVEVELLQAAQSSGDVYFRLLQYLGDAITKVILGQTASSGDSTGLSGGDAQSRVRQDILDSDARAVEAAVNRDLIRPFMLYNFDPRTAPPKLALETAEPEDAAQLAAMVASLYNGGLAADPEEIGRRLGLKLTRRPEPSAMSGVMPSGLELADRAEPAPSGLADALERWLGPVADAVGAANLDDESISDEEFGRRLAALAEAKTGDGKAVENLMSADMRREYDRGSQISGR
ncbi:MAG: DUF935 family protein [Lentisphaeria bacterium]|nr:DUF935 family protein [Lentisphaeria bacterium]